MNNKVVSGYGMKYIRLTKKMAEKAFKEGFRVYVMSIDRNPINSLSSPYIYYRGCKPIMSVMNVYSEFDCINTFDELLEDFSTWLDTDGYGHCPQRYDAKHYRFSYWLKEQ